MEGVASEAASLAGHLKLGKLVCLYDDNYVSLAAGTDITFSEDRAKRFEAYGWQTIMWLMATISTAISKALDDARAETDKPTLILVRTHIGFGSPEQDSFKAHGSPLGVEDVKKTKQNLGWPVAPDFLVPEEALTHFRQAQDDGARAEQAWDERMAAYAKAFPDQARELTHRLAGKLVDGWDSDIPVVSRRCQGHVHARGRRQGDECVRGKSAWSVRWIGGSRFVDLHQPQGRR